MIPLSIEGIRCHPIKYLALRLDKDFAYNNIRFSMVDKSTKLEICFRILLP